MANQFLQRLFGMGPGSMPTYRTPPFLPTAQGGGPPSWSTPPFLPTAAGGSVAASNAPLVPTYGKGIPPWLQKLHGGFNKFANSMAGVQNNPGLTPQENDALAQRQRHALMSAAFQASAPRPRGTGSPLADLGAVMQAGAQAGDQFTADALRTKLMQAQIAQAQQQQAPTYGSTIGKMLADRDLAAEQGNTAGVDTIDKAIAKELGGSGTDLSEVLRVRNDVTRNSAEFVAAQTGYDKVIAAAQSDSPAGDMSLIFGFMKVLDPGSIVKEGEFATVQNSAGIPEQIRGVYNRVLRGERLTPEQRADFTHQARQQFDPMIERQQRLVDDAKAFSERNKLPFADIVPEYLLPVVPEPIARPPDRDPGSQLPTLWGQIKDDFGRLLRPKAPADMTDEEIEAELQRLQSGDAR